MSKTSRRSLLSTVPIAAAAAVSPSVAKAFPAAARSAGPDEPDPIFVLLERYLAGQRAFELACDGPAEDAGDALFDDRGLRMELASTVPTTPAGLMAYATFLDEQSRHLQTPFFDAEFGETAVFFAALHRAVAALTGYPGPPDGDHDAELVGLCREIESLVVALDDAKERERLAWATYRDRMPPMPQTLRWSERDEDRMMMPLGRDEAGFLTAAAVKEIGSFKGRLNGWLDHIIGAGPSGLDQLKPEAQKRRETRAAWCEARAEQILSAWRDWLAARAQEKLVCEVDKRTAEHLAVVAEIEARVSRLKRMKPVTMAGVREWVRWSDTYADRDGIEVDEVFEPRADGSRSARARVLGIV